MRKFKIKEVTNEKLTFDERFNEMYQKCLEDVANGKYGYIFEKDSTREVNETIEDDEENVAFKGKPFAGATVTLEEIIARA